MVLVFANSGKRGGIWLQFENKVRLQDLIQGKMWLGPEVKPEKEVDIPPETNAVLLIKFINQAWSQFCRVRHKLQPCLCLKISSTNTGWENLLASCRLWSCASRSFLHLIKVVSWFFEVSCLLCCSWVRSLEWHSEANIWRPISNIIPRTDFMVYWGLVIPPTIRWLSICLSFSWSDFCSSWVWSANWEGCFSQQMPRTPSPEKGKCSGVCLLF